MGFVYMYSQQWVRYYEEIVFGADGIARVNDVETRSGPTARQT